MQNTIKWGMIGCGDVTEVKSGPAFNKVPNSALIAVMSRNAFKAEDYARRHRVPKWYSDTQALIDDPEINAIYIATPPLSHQELTIAALKAGKSVYVEKPMAIHAAAGQQMVEAAARSNGKLTIAHYRREQPVFKKIRALIDEQAIGAVKFVTLEYLQPSLSPKELADPKIQWRLDPVIAGGGLFHDIAPHQLDLMLYFFGPIEKSIGISGNQGGLYQADDLVTGVLKFKNNVFFNGTWCFDMPAGTQKDLCIITGSKGTISFPVFGPGKIELIRDGKTEVFNFDALEHVQQPMIGATVRYFLNETANPCIGEDGLTVMEIIDQFTKKED
ncbi:putative dehydrogenase [Pedobacter cryoconitis]|uniref:Putative dehydrogenase n=1 Tax=Pedobacter cryoconitis TaxID=188932 RepID=A0A7W8ZPG7_9SPHI|nr:Gfo/Idh/MocA family oxidoreductase [Pedobacter cryoconitis]MBB5637788.1 putative dehydrogenase [Pedobacter cryoconitis]